MDSYPYYTAYVATVIIAVLLVCRRIRPQVYLSLPPGPRPWPIIGNLLDFPSAAPWTTFDRLGKTYGDVIHMRVMGHSVVVLMSIFLCDLVEAGWAMVLQGYTDSWRRSRRVFRQYFNRDVAPKFQEIQREETQAFLLRLHRSPDEVQGLVRHLFSSMIMRIMYGIKISEQNDPYVAIAEEVMKGFSEAGQPGRFYVDFIPFLRYIPTWFPGALFHKRAASLKPVFNAMVNKPFNVVKDSIVSGSTIPSVVLSMLEGIHDGTRREEDEMAVKSSAASAYAGGADTTRSAIQLFLLAMVLYPDVQRRAQAELQSIVGSNRMPAFADRPSLPYVQALILEILRWQPVAPLSMPHSTSSSDTYRGYYIPKGAIVIGNAWSILHDPQHYPNPFSFNPERFLKNGRLDSDVLSPTVVCFGFGRRICPGQFFALDSLYIIVSSILQLFDISHKIDECGQQIAVDVRLTSGLISSTEPFACSFKLRSAAAEALFSSLPD
ncbi:unnamed protein product [Somion occarium]|uniref:Cytochrome P450 n=1 Tax=Somion occarium TaxID=3059160 RepID=A0ABP1DT88_9APHY